MKSKAKNTKEESKSVMIDKNVRELRLDLSAIVLFYIALMISQHSLKRLGFFCAKQILIPLTV